MKKSRQQFVAKLRRQRSGIAAELVRAQKIHDDLRPHRLRMLQADMKMVNDQIRKAQQ